jgi:hypothetical protein
MLEPEAGAEPSQESGKYPLSGESTMHRLSISQFDPELSFCLEQASY